MPLSRNHWNTGEDAPGRRPQAINLSAYEDKVSKESSAPRNKQQTKASANVIQGSNALSQAGSRIASVIYKVGP